jgi:SAM-dependent methyltransferase
MHDAVRVFLEDVKTRHPGFFKKKNVLEIGSRNLNGSAREHFKKCVWLGVDQQPGPGVDVIALGHELTYPDGSFDVCLSCECLEHDKFKEQTVRSMIRMLKPGGLCIVTAAADNRAPHELHCGIEDYYENVPAAFFDAFRAEFKEQEIRIAMSGEDVQFYGIKTGEYLP